MGGLIIEENRISYHESVKTVYKTLKEQGLTNVWDRYAAQGFGDDPDKRCSFCMGGARCDLCSNGPCRADESIDKRGVCGITADGMTMRTMLLRNILGATTYQYHAQTTIRTLKDTSQKKTPYKISEPEKLISFAQRLDVDTNGSYDEVALRLCEMIQADFNRPSYEESEIVRKLAPKDRLLVWRKLGIMPGGIYYELMNANGSCLTNVDGYYVSLALKAMRLSIAMAYQSQIVCEYLQDILFGIPNPHQMRVDLGVLDSDYINILPNGHEPFLGFALADVANDEKWQDIARNAGARGLRIIANIETGQEMVQRLDMNDVFYGYTGNWIAQEAVLATGAVDVFVADMNCSLPVDPIYAEKFGFRLIPVSELVAFEGISERINYDPIMAKEQAEELIKAGISNFPKRRALVKPIRGLPVREATVGFSPESIIEALGGTLKPLLDSIKSGQIRGIVGLVSCTSLRDSGQDIHSVAVAKELIKRDLLVLSMGCGNAAMQVAGLCSPDAADYAGGKLGSLCRTLKIPPVLSFGTCTDTGRCADLIAAVSDALGGIPVSDLPVAAAAPEYMEQKATIDAIFALAYGLYTYVNPVPFVTGAPNLVKLLTEDCKNVTGGILNVEKDPVKAAEGILQHIESNRKKIGI